MLCGCGRVVLLRRCQAAAPGLALLGAVALAVAVIANPQPMVLLGTGIAAVAALVNQVWLTYRIAELAGTGFCSVCTGRGTRAAGPKR